MLERYGVSDDDAFAVGLTCGGILDVYVEKVTARPSPSSARSPPTSRPAARSPLATVIEHPDPAWLGRRLVIRPGGIVPDETVRNGPGTTASVGTTPIARQSRGPTTRCTTTRWGCWPAGTNATLTYGPDGERRGEGMRVFVWAFAPKPRLLVFGAIDFAAAVARVGSFLGYHVTVCDARPVFATDEPLPRGRRGGRRLAAPLPRRPSGMPAGSTRGP